jgi:putative acetyltransferase
VNAPRSVYRPALPGDVPAMIGVHYAAVQAVDRRHYSDDVLAAWSPPPDASRRDWLAGLISRDSTLCTVAVSANEVIVGFCIALPEQGLLKALYVHPDFAGEGIGQGLLQLKEEQCRDLGLVALEVNASLNAAAFYRRNGYEALGPVSQHLTDTVVMGATRMVKRFPKVA